MTLTELVRHVGGYPIDAARVAALFDAMPLIGMTFEQDYKAILSDRQVRMLCAACQVELPEGVMP